MTTPPVCDYEGSDYQSTFWDKGEREYEDRVEAIALRRLLPKHGRIMLELGAGAGRNTSRYTGFEWIVLLDYSRSQLEQAQKRLGQSDKYIFVAADVYRLPFLDGTFDTATMIRTLHHMADAPMALEQAHDVLEPDGIFILEFANKLNLKSILRYFLRRQDWSPFRPEPVEFAELNFDFHPGTVRRWLQDLGFDVRKTLSVSHFRIGFIKRVVPTRLLVFFDSLFQWSGALWQLTPSVFLKCQVSSDRFHQVSGVRSQTPGILQNPVEIFKCPECGGAPLSEKTGFLECPGCGRKWGLKDGIYDFREALS